MRDPQAEIIQLRSLAELENAVQLSSLPRY
jgi:hypothetical protein